MAPRKRKQELTREMIMDAARDIFTSKGYQHVSMRMIANQLGYSHGAIYYHFNNKAELFTALVEDHFNMLNEALEEIMRQNIDPQEKLKQIFIGFIKFGLTYQNHYEIMFLTKEDEVKNLINQGPMNTYENFAKSVHSLCDHHITVQEIWSVFLSLHGFVTHYCRHVHRYEEVQGLAESHAQFLINAIQKKK